MIPWPIALVVLLYGLIAASSAARMWQGIASRSVSSSAWSLAWCLMAGAVVVGLAWLRPWARRLAVWSSLVMMLGALGAALFTILQPTPHPRHSLVATGMASLYLVVSRYLSRPRVKAWFGVGERGKVKGAR